MRLSPVSDSSSSGGDAAQSPPVLRAAHGWGVLVPDLVLFLGQDESPTEFDEVQDPNLARTGLY